MILTADQMPTEVVEALAVAWRNEMNSAHALAAALSAWPQAHEKPYWELRTHERYSELILPLPKKAKP